MATKLKERKIGFGLLFFEMILLIIGQFLFQYAASSLPILPGFEVLTHPGGALILLKAWSGLAFSPYFILALVFYGGAVWTWMAALQILPISQAMPVLALVFVLVPLASFLHQGIFPPMRLMLGVLFVVLSIILIAGDNSQNKNQVTGEQGNHS
ncbi:MAG: hypothetical protein ORN98_06990 [Alphaproteobacteria bacterium]|nr:hypothetical protein [Alphaproteobacteria bacterium]